MDEASKLLSDKAEIEELAVLFCRGNDFDANFYDRCLTEDVVVEYPARTWTGREETKRRRNMGLGTKTAWTFHHITNAIIKVDGDKGWGEYYIMAPHGMTAADGSKAIIYAGCMYLHDVVRTPDGWRIAKHQCIVTWNDISGEMKQLLGPADPPPWERLSLGELKSAQ